VIASGAFGKVWDETNRRRFTAPVLVDHPELVFALRRTAEQERITPAG
jgi:hypothetical protein